MKLCRKRTVLKAFSHTVNMVHEGKQKQSILVLCKYLAVI